MGKQRKTWSPEIKEQLVLTVLRGEQTVAELARQHGVAESLIHKWRTQFLEAGRARLGSDALKNPVLSVQGFRKRLKVASIFQNEY